MSESFSVVEFVKAAALSMPFVVGIVLSVVKWLGGWGVEGRGKLLASLVSGVVIGGALMYFQLYPTLAVEWFSVGLYGLLAGLTASGVYDVSKEVAEKGYSAALKKTE